MQKNAIFAIKEKKFFLLQETFFPFCFCFRNLRKKNVFEFIRKISMYKVIIIRKETGIMAF